MSGNNRSRAEGRRGSAGRVHGCTVALRTSSDFGPALAFLIHTYARVRGAALMMALAARRELAQEADPQAAFGSLCRPISLLDRLGGGVGAHHVGRHLKEMGHDVRLMPANYVRPYLKGQ
jgi:hypothetical protein